MNSKKNSRLKPFLLTLGLTVSGLGTAEAADQSHLLATASTGGTYYPVGVAIATLSKVKLQPTHKVSLSAINSAGSGENIKLLRDNEVQFAILQGLYGSYANKGTGPLEKEGPQKNLRSITMLWQNVEQFVVKSEHVKTGTIEDMLALKGAGKLALGKKNSGTIGSNRKLLGNLGADIDNDFELVYGGYGPSAAALQNGQVDGISTPAGTPTGALTKLFASVGDDVTMLEYTDEQMLKADGDLNLWTRFVIPKGTYPGQSEDIKTIAQPNFLAVRDDVDEEFVYLLTKTLYENLPFLQAIHKATKAMSIDKALAGLPLPLHPGAVRYYKEVGLQIPDNLIAN
jgi:TRAP transporter TAXI family solute receptor